MRLHLLFSSMLMSVAIFANNSITESDKQFFIDTYAAMAVSEMNFSEIPASIILAQAILESGWGRGKVAEGANNYFCIKCFNGWEGPTFDAKDDEPGLSCFRKYQTVFESFRDHSLFLKEGQRYQPLFELDKTDFRGWAKGLKDCGYATDNSYGEKLIELIEEHGLWIFDYAIPEGYFAAIDSSVVPIGSTVADEPVLVADQSTVSNETQMAMNAPILAVPYYQVDRELAPAQEPAKEIFSPMKPDRGRKKRIRPIVPHPSIYYDRAE